VQKEQQDRDKKAARLGQNWGKSDGVNEHDIGILAVVSPFIPIGYERFSMGDFPTFP
jgi:hypothetical protein